MHSSFLEPKMQIGTQIDIQRYQFRIICVITSHDTNKSSHFWMYLNFYMLYFFLSYIEYNFHLFSLFQMKMIELFFITLDKIFMQPKFLRCSRDGGHLECAHIRVHRTGCSKMALARLGKRIEKGAAAWVIARVGTGGAGFNSTLSPALWAR